MKIHQPNEGGQLFSESGSGENPELVPLTLEEIEATRDLFTQLGYTNESADSAVEPEVDTLDMAIEADEDGGDQSDDLEWAA